MPRRTAVTVKGVSFRPAKGEEFSGGAYTFTGCVTKGTLAELGCKVKGGKVETFELTAESRDGSMQIEFKPPAGGPMAGVFAIVTLNSCSNEELNAAWTVTGTAKALGEGTTLRSSNLTTTGLKFGGSFGTTLTSAGTLRMSGGGNPITATTTEL